MLTCVYVNATFLSIVFQQRKRGKRRRGFMTVKEIAELAGVSIGTVDRVLHSRGRVSRSTRERIETIIKDTGFSSIL